MKVRSMELVNYRRHRDTRLELPDGVSAVVGRNGSGKSTLIEGIAFALFGPPATRTAKDLLRHAAAAATDPVRVSVELETAGQAVRVTRELRGRNLVPSASLEADGVLLVAPGSGSADAVTRHVERLLGMDREAFFATVVARQKELSRLADHSPAERKRLVLGMLGVDRIDRAIERARGRRRAVQERVAAIRELLGDRKAMAGALEGAQGRHRDALEAEAQARAGWEAAAAALDAAAAALERERRAERAHREAVLRLQAAQATARHAREVLEGAAGRLKEAAAAAEKAGSLGPTGEALAQAEATLQEAEAQAAAALRRSGALQAAQTAREEAERLGRELEREAAAEAQVEVCRARRDAARSAAEESGRRLAALQERVRHLRERHRRFSALGAEAPCPTCERPLEGHRDRVLAELGEEYGNAREELAGAQEEAAAVRTSLEETEKALAQAEGQERLRQALEERLRQARLRAEAAQAAVPEDPGPAPDLEKLRGSVAEARTRHEERLRLDALASRLEGLRREQGQAEARLREAEDGVVAAQGAVADAPDPGKGREAAEEAHAAALQREREAERGVARCTKDVAVAAHALSDAQRRLEEEQERRRRLRGLEEEAQYWGALAGPRGGGLLDRFRDHLVHRVGPAIAAEASRLLARFTDGRYTEVLLDDDYRVFVGEGGVAYTIDRFSGGEADLVHLSLRLAVSRLLAERSGAEMRFLALDEVFGSLDEERRALVVRALRGLGGLYAQVLLVTHLESMRDALDRTVVVEERDGEATVRVSAG